MTALALWWRRRRERALGEPAARMLALVLSHGIGGYMNSGIIASELCRLLNHHFPHLIWNVVWKTGSTTIEFERIAVRRRA